jgi:cytoskeletal protein RodZ
MPTVSEQLRRAREAQKLDTYQVAEITKIKTDHVRALESGNFDTFSAPVYIRGFVRTYATMLKLDVPQVLADLDDELSRSEKFRDPPPLTNQPRGAVDFLMLQFSRLNWRVAAAVVVAVVVLLLVVAAFHSRTHKPADPLKNLGPGVYQPSRHQSGETLPLPTNPPPARR